MKIKAFIFTILFYSFFFILFFVLKYMINYAWNNVRSDVYFLIISVLKAIVNLFIAFMVVLIIPSYKEIFSVFYDFIKIKNIDFEQFSYDDLRIMVKRYYTIDTIYNRKSLTVISSSIICIILFILIYFFCAILLDIFASNMSYVYIQLTWTLLFTGFFYVNYNKFFNICSRESDIYILLVILYSIALLFNKNTFYNLISLYQPFDNTYRNMEMQKLLYDSLKKYSNYLIDWALLQGVTLSILIYNDFGSKRQYNYEQKLNKKKKKLSAIHLLINIMEEIDNDKHFLEYCEELESGLINENIDYQNRIISYHNDIKDISSEIKQSEFSELLDVFPINLLNSQTFIDNYIKNKDIPRLKICRMCRCAFLDNSNSVLCKECTKLTSIKIR